MGEREPDDDEDDSFMRPPPICRRCQSSLVRWRRQGGKWVLFALQAGVEHSCDVADDFDDLTQGANHVE